MKNIKIYTLLVCLLGTSIAAFSQNVEFDKANFKEQKDEFKKAEDVFKEGDNYLELEYPDYNTALGFYLQAQDFNPKCAELNYKIGVCYANSSNKSKAIPYLLQANSLDNTVAADLYYYLGIAYHANYQFDEAINSFRKYKESLTPDALNEKGTELNKRIAENKVGKTLFADSVRVFIDNMGDSVNTKYSDYSPMISADQSMLVFTSKRANPYNKKIDPWGEYDENIWVSYRVGKKWTKAVDMGKPLNTAENDATIGLSPDGQKMFTYYGKKGGDIMYSEMDGDSWSSPKYFDEVNSSEGHESAASFSYDGRTIYFVSNNTNKVQNFGDHDIYKIVLDEKGKWSDPINLGATINTPYDEVDVFMHPDGRTMYFSSDGHTTMGGYDVFKTTLQDDGSWSEPENIGYPINTPGDERFFVLGGSGRIGYYSSSKDGGMGEYDVYEIIFLGPEKKLQMMTENLLIASQSNSVKQEVVIEKSVEIKTSRLTIVKGVVSDAFAKELTYLEATIEISDNETGKIISTLKSNSATGKFLIPLPSGKNYGIAVKKDGYLFHSENFDIPQTSTYQEVSLDIKLMKIKKDSKIVLRNVFFETGSAKLDPKSFVELDNLTKILTDNPTMKIEIGGHTDNQGSYALNQKLSQDRAQAVVNYIAQKIDKSRLTFKGYAYDQPVADNATAEGRAQNRRVEFKIVSNEE